MALKKIQPTNDENRNPFGDQQFSIGMDGKILQFYDHNGVKKVYEIHRYGKDKALYFKKETNDKIAYL